MSKSKYIQKANKKLEERFLIKEQNIKFCEKGDKGTLHTHQDAKGQWHYALSKTESYLQIFCIVPDRNTIKTYTLKPGEKIPQ